jgi:hypothetical protein
MLFCRCSRLCRDGLCSLLLLGLGLRRSHHQQRELCGTQDVFSDTAHDQPEQATAPMCRHGDQVVATGTGINVYQGLDNPV